MRIIDRYSMQARHREGDYILHRSFNVYGREVPLDIRVVAGEIQDRPFFRDGGPRIRDFLGANQGVSYGAAGELLTTPANLSAFVQKTIVDLEIGRADVPVLYQPMYRNITDSNLTEMVDVRALSSRANVVFLDHIEGEEVKFGTREMVPGEPVPIITYAAGFEYTEDLAEYDKTWEVTQLNEGMGRSYNALLNHLHIYPLISYTYPAKNHTDGATEADAGSTEYRVRLRRTIQRAMQDAAADQNTDSGVGRYPTVLLARSTRRWDLEEALGRFTLNGTEYPPVSGPDTLIFYDGWSIKVGAKTYQYPGVADDRFYLIDTSTYLVELVKHDLRVDAGPGDLSRLIAQQIVGRARRGVFCSPANAVQEVMFPT